MARMYKIITRVTKMKSMIYQLCHLHGDGVLRAEYISYVIYMEMVFYEQNMTTPRSISSWGLYHLHVSVLHNAIKCNTDFDISGLF